MPQKNKLILIDGHSLAYRAFFALPEDMKTSHGELTNAVFGFTSMLLNVLRDEQPTHVAVAFDKGRTFRHDIYAEYKAHRAKMPDEMRSQMARVRQVVETLGIPVFEQEGYEADDLLGTLARQAGEQGVDTLIVTGDRDLLQLVDERTHVLTSSRRFSDTIIYDTEGVERRYGLTPAQLVDLKALMGDQSDNIPGVRGVGEKTATELLQQYGSLEQVYAHLDEVQTRFRNKLAEGRDMAYLSRRLGAIVRDVPVQLDLDACQVHSFDRELALALFRELEFRSLAERLPGAEEQPRPVGAPHQLSLFGAAPAAAVAAAPSADYQIVADGEALRRLAARLASAPALTLDTETTSTDPMLAELVGIALTDEAKRGYYIPIQAPPGDHQLDLDTVLDALTPLLADPARPKYGHNLKYDLTVLEQAGARVEGLAFDTMVAEWLINPISKNLGLKNLAWVRLQQQMTPITDLIGTGKNQLTMDQVGVAQVAPYACLNRDSPVLLNDGKTIKIGEIVNKRLSVQVLCMNERTGEMESKRVVNWFERQGPYGQEWYKIVTKYTQRSKWGTPVGPVFTPDHKVLTTEGWKTVVDLVPGDKVYAPEPQLTHTQTQLILGSCLGDGSLERRNGRLASFYVGHAEKQREYLCFKASILKNVIDRPEWEASGPNRCGNATEFWRIQTRHLRGIADLGDIMYLNGTKTVTQEWLERLDVIGLAFWYLDDGVLADSRIARFIVHALSDEKVALVQTHIEERWGFESTLYKDKRKKRGLTIAITSSSSKRFFDLIAPCVPPSMQYKLPPEYRGRFRQEFFSDVCSTVPYCEEVVKVIEYKPKLRGTYRMRYCIEVEDNHNFFTTTCLAKNCADVDMTHRLVEVLKPELQEKRLWSLFTEVEMELLPALAAMETAGVRLDASFLEQMSGELAARLGELEAQIHEEAGHAFNINSTQQLSDVLFDKLGLPTQGMRRTKSGHFSTAADVLERLRGKHAVIDLILEQRELAKLKSTYVDALPRLVNPRTGRLHTSYNQTGTTTGRVSSSNPNLQNIPIRTELGRRVRRAFVAEPGWKLIGADYSQVELRVMAHISGDEGLLGAFARGEDIHASTAAAIMGVPLAEVTPDMRRVAKAVNFGLSYGQTAYGLANATGLTQAEAEDFIKTYFERFPRVREYIDTTKALATRQGYVETLLGRRRYFPELGPGSKAIHNVRQAAERVAINAPIQGTAADIINIATIRLHRVLREGLRARMILQVHDELVVEAPEGEVETVAPLMRKVMEGAFDLKAPLKADLKSGENWDEMERM